MSLTDLDVRQLPIKEKRYKKSCGDGLSVVVEPVKGKSGKSFVGRMRFPPSRKGKEVNVRVGVYGKGNGKISLKKAKSEWERLRSWSRENNRNPNELIKEEKRTLILSSSDQSNEVNKLGQVVDLYFELSTN